MSTGAEPADHLADGHGFTGIQCTDYWLICCADSAVVKADHRLAADRSDERHCALSSRKNCLTRFGDKIDTAMSRSPNHRRGIEPSLHHRSATQRPAGRGGQSTGRRGRCWNGDHAQADRKKKQRYNVAAKGSHAGSLRMPTLIVQSVANLWTRLDAAVRLWTTGTRTSFAMRTSFAIPAMCATREARTMTAGPLRRLQELATETSEGPSPISERRSRRIRRTNCQSAIQSRIDSPVQTCHRV
jgi:hypothetical protein